MTAPLYTVLPLYFSHFGKHTLKTVAVCVLVGMFLLSIRFELLCCLNMKFNVPDIFDFVYSCGRFCMTLLTPHGGRQQMAMTSPNE